MRFVTEDGHFRNVARIALTEGENTAWIEVLPQRKISHPKYGELDITRAQLEEMMQNFDNNVRGVDLAIDYAHRKDPSKGEKAAGWVQKMKVDKASNGEGDSLFYFVEFTPQAAGEIRSGEWRYISADYATEWPDGQGNTYNNVAFGAGLTNRPFMKGMAPISLAELDGFEMPSGKFDAETASLGLASSSTRRCLNCAFFRPGTSSDDVDSDGDGGSCLVVEGVIDPDQVCNYFEAVYISPFGMLYDEDETASDGSGIFLTDEEVEHEFRDISTKERKAAPSSDYAWPETRSYPILKAADVTAAFHSIGRLKGGKATDAERARLRANIIRIAKRKGFPLPDSAKKLDEEVTVEDAERKALLARIGLSEDSTEEQLLAGVSELADYRNKQEKKVEQERTFAEQYPDQAKRLADLEQKDRKNDAAAVVRKLNEAGIPPVVNAKLTALLLGESEITLSEEGKEDRKVGVTFSDVLFDVAKAGTVKTGTTRPKTGESTEVREELEGGEQTFDSVADEISAKARKLMEATEGMEYMDARKKVIADDPDLAKRALVKPALVVA